MPIYEFKCLDCGDVFLFTSNEATSHVIQSEGGTCECGPLQRIWNANVVWPKEQRGH